MMKYIGKKLGVSTFWKFEKFNKYFLNFVKFFLCFYFLIKVWLRKKRYFLVFCNFREKASKILVFVGIYKYKQKRFNKDKRVWGDREVGKIQRFRWRRKKIEKENNTVIRLNRHGLRFFSSKPVPTTFLKNKKFKKINKNTLQIKMSSIGGKGVKNLIKTRKNLVRKKNRHLFFYSRWVNPWFHRANLRAEFILGGGDFWYPYGFFDSRWPWRGLWKWKSRVLKHTLRPFFFKYARKLKSKFGTLKKISKKTKSRWWRINKKERAQFNPRYSKHFCCCRWLDRPPGKRVIVPKIFKNWKQEHFVRDPFFNFVLSKKPRPLIPRFVVPKTISFFKKKKKN